MHLHGLNSIAILTFEPDDIYPRLSRAVVAELSDLLDSLKRESAFRGIVIAANSKSFPTGAEIEELIQLTGIAASEFAATGQSLFTRIAHFPVPVVAAIRGFCLGGGLDLALACQQRVATFDASFGHPGASLGLMTGWGGTQRLPRLVGRAAALQMLLTGERVPATQALTLGLVHELASSIELLECAARRAGEIAESWNACRKALG